MVMDTEKLQRYINLLTIAGQIGQGLANIIRGYAQRDLSPEEYDALQGQWDALVDRTARNAGLPPTP